MATVKLQTSDNEIFEVDREVAFLCKTVKNFCEDVDMDDNTVVPLPNVTGSVMKKVLEFCEYHKEEYKGIDFDEMAEKAPNKVIDMNNKAITEWDANFIKVDQPFLFEIILAANYLHIQPLLDLSCKTVANMIKGKSPQEIRETFNIPNDFTPEEEEKVRKENAWTEDDSMNVDNK